MSVSKEEMLAELDYLEGAALLPHSERTDAIRALILAVEKWQQRIIKLLAMGPFGAKDSWVSLREDIRDFGKEKNENTK